VFLLISVVAVGLLGGPAAAATNAAGRVRPDLAGAFIGQINAERATHGRSRLVVDSNLTSVAQGWALSMSKTSVLAHNPRLATSVRGWRYLGENVGVGYSVASLEQAFWASAPHRSNMLDSDYLRVGVGVVDVGGGKLWVVEDFSRPAGATTSRHRASPAHRSAVRPAARPSAQPSKRQPPAGHRATTAHSTVDALMSACAAQAARLFLARHWLRPGVEWTRLRASLRT
jgi:hypothetical protein